MGSASDPLSERRSWTAEEICSHWNWAPGSSLNNEFSLTWRLARNALSLLGLMLASRMVIYDYLYIVLLNGSANVAG